MKNRLLTPNSSAQWQSDACGVLCGALAAVLVHQLGQRQLLGTPFLLIIILMTSSTVAGFSLPFFRPTLLEKPTKAIGNGCWFGWKAGWRTALIAGAILCVLATLNALAAPNSSAEVHLKAKMWSTCYVSLAALLPSVLCGFIGGAIGAWLARARIPSDINPHPPSAASGYKWPFRFLSWLSFLLIASPLMFLGRDPKVDPPPVVVAKPLPTPASVPPPFRYEVSAELRESRFNQLQVGFVKTIGNVAENRAMSLSHDGRLFAYCSQGDGNSGIAAFDLHTFKVIANFIVSEDPADSLVWSPDMKRLACLCRGGSASSSLWILSLEDERAMELPRPPGTDVPLGEFFWWSAEELAFFPPDEAPLVFRLDTLAFAPLHESKFFADKSEQEKKRWTEGPRFEPPSSPQWRFGVAAGVQADRPPPRRNQDAAYQWKVKFFCSFADPQSPRHNLLTDLPVNEGMRVFCAPDGSKIIRAINGQAEVAYLKTSEPDTKSVEVDIPVPENALIPGVGDRQLCSFVYAPLTNPLNGQTIGPDHRRIKAFLRLVEWKAGKASFVVCHATETINATDVVATLHTWSEGLLVPWRHEQADGWWTTVGTPAKADALLSSITSLEPVEFPQALALEPSGTSYLVVAAKTPFVKGASDTKVRSFLMDHHSKASQGDLAGLLANYAETVDFLEKGQISRDRIGADESAHRERWPKGQEVVQGDIRLSREGSLWRASYTMMFRNENNAGGWQKGLADLTLDVSVSPNGMRIVGQKAVVRDVHEGGPALAASRAEPARPSPPPVKVRLPSPVWTSSTTGTLGTETLAVHDAVHFKNGRATLHRTYRILVSPKTPKSVASKFPNGLVCMMTAEMEGSLTQTGPQDVEMYCGVQGWLRTSDASAGEFNSVCGRDAERTVGTVLKFRFDGEDLIEGQGGSRMKLVRK